MKMKIRAKRMIKVKTKSFLPRSTAPFVETPPFNPETPWDDDFAFKTTCTKRSSMAQLQGDEDPVSAYGCNSNLTRSSVLTRKNAL